jgi:hypothetical protein
MSPGVHVAWMGGKVELFRVVRQEYVQCRAIYYGATVLHITVL